ncbi:hypothetical protein AB4305_33485 [Nocardia sp. 2YAB30]
MALKRPHSATARCFPNTPDFRRRPARPVSLRRGRFLSGREDLLWSFFLGDFAVDAYLGQSVECAIDNLVTQAGASQGSTQLIQFNGMDKFFFVEFLDEIRKGLIPDVVGGIGYACFDGVTGVASSDKRLIRFTIHGVPAADSVRCALFEHACFECDNKRFEPCFEGGVGDIPGLVLAAELDELPRFAAEGAL